MTISEKTVVPISLLVVLAPLFYWITTTATATARNSTDIETIRIERAELQRDISAIRADLMGISAKVDIIRDYIVETPKRVREK